MQHQAISEKGGSNQVLSQEGEMLVPELQAEPKLAYPHNASFTTSDPEQNVSTTTKSELPTEPIQGEELMPKLTYTHNLCLSKT